MNFYFSPKSTCSLPLKDCSPVLSCIVVTLILKMDLEKTEESMSLKFSVKEKLKEFKLSHAVQLGQDGQYYMFLCKSRYLPLLRRVVSEVNRGFVLRCMIWRVTINN